jgi:hypothetical protein
MSTSHITVLFGLSQLRSTTAKHLGTLARLALAIFKKYCAISANATVNSVNSNIPMLQTVLPFSTSLTRGSQFSTASLRCILEPFHCNAAKFVAQGAACKQAVKDTEPLQSLHCAQQRDK